MVTAVATAAGGRYPLTLRDVSGELELDRQGRPLRAQIEARVDTLVAGSDLVARAAKSPRFLDARRHPTARFEVERFSLDAGGEGDVVGVLTLHGVSKRVRVPVRIEQANGRLRATAEFSIQRSDYGIKPGGALEWVVGDTIAVRARAVSQTGPCTH